MHTHNTPHAHIQQQQQPHTPHTYNHPPTHPQHTHKTMCARTHTHYTKQQQHTHTTSHTHTRTPVSTQLTKSSDLSSSRCTEFTTILDHHLLVTVSGSEHLQTTGSAAGVHPQLSLHGRHALLVLWAGGTVNTLESCAHSGLFVVVAVFRQTLYT